MTLWLALDFPRLPLEVFTRGQDPVPPLVVRGDQRVLLASDAAIDRGILPGMRLATAQSLCDTLRVQPRQTEREQQALRRLAVRLLAFTPTICPQPPTGLLLEIGGCLKLFHGLEPLLERLRTALDEAGFSARPALGHTPLAAWQLTALPLAAGIDCVTHNQPDHGAFRDLLAQLPLETLRLEEKQRQRLAAPGFRILGDILALPRESLGRRHGTALLAWLEQLLGERPDPRTPLQPPMRFYADIAFADPVEQADGLLFPMQRLLDDLEHHLRRHQQSVRAIRWHFRPLRGSVERLVIRRARPGHDAAGWLQLTRRRLEQYRLTAPALELALDTEKPLPRATGADDLFADPGARPGADVLLEKLAALPGLYCYTPREQNEPLPEAADNRCDPLAPESGAETDTTPFRDRPLWLLDPPRALTFRDDKPLWLNEPLEWLPGTERYSSHWWQPPGHAREYRIAKHSTGMCCWVFRERRSGRWFVQGFF